MGALDIAIAGCGPAGMAAALLLHRDGHRVVIFERFDTPRPIGSGLMIQPTGLAVLRKLGLDQQIVANGARIERLSGQAGGATVLDVRYAALGKQDLFGIGIHRAALFGALHQAVRAEGIPIETGRTLAAASEGERRILTFEDGATAGPFDLVVDALGAHSRLAPPSGRALAYGALWASLDWPPDAGFDGEALQQRYRAASVMAGVLPIGAPPGVIAPQAAFFWSLREDALPAWRAAGLRAWKDEVLALWPATAPLLDQIRDPGQLTFARYAHRTVARPARPGLIQIGDAWHSTSPQLGQGANMALLDAYALALALRGEPTLGEALKKAIRLRRRHVRLYQAMSLLFTPVYQSDSRILPFLRDRVVGPLSKLWPATWIQAAMVGGLVGDPLGPLGL
ncbi:2-polyprenyl-6-methoxyphenol hydroxylase-like FAD-dependent oxidoreductase [Caulobacter ginsengisoli]|uniref:2-polyprenyl-6-methoxyphenol hydroxylase-like FAD-dependent oxidoreductase n=1 Tax=Caulobacter ginsengisoli TaxID=400775 RepID=A0ABU0IU33_9CAUL|nr:NAD(P)/FAD-dependent oxidoreductase [Caulobacter ginsengisoli]MDQ0465517.1 2-polyprenyl-6-methoxyphenol hydroxylase-like FAD-dependent oxidoreductase [Caulobacter ginsengisoli]